MSHWFEDNARSIGRTPLVGRGFCRPASENFRARLFGVEPYHLREAGQQQYFRRAGVGVRPGRNRRQR